MKIQFWTIGKGHEAYVKEGIETFTKRISHYFPIEWKIITSPKNAGNMEVEELKAKEAELVINTINADDYIILLDEKGKNITSEKLANLLQASANEARKNIIFIIGGAFGAGEKLKSRADFIWSLSSLVFPHQLVRLIISEQVYRACTILRNEKYHHT